MAYVLGGGMFCVSELVPVEYGTFLEAPMPSNLSLPSWLENGLQTLNLTLPVLKFNSSLFGISGLFFADLKPSGKIRIDV